MVDSYHTQEKNARGSFNRDTEQNPSSALTRSGRSAGKVIHRVLPVKLLQLFVQFGVTVFQLARLLEEKLRGNGKKLRRVGRAVFIQQRHMSAFERGEKLFVFLAENSDPGCVTATPMPKASAAQEGNAIGDAILLIQLVGKLVKHEVVTIRRVCGAGDC